MFHENTGGGGLQIFRKVCLININRTRKHINSILYYLSNFPPVYSPRLQAISFSCFRIVLELLVEFLAAEILGEKMFVELISAILAPDSEIKLCENY